MQVSIIFYHCFHFQTTNLNEWICILFHLCYIWSDVTIRFYEDDDLDDDEIQSYISEYEIQSYISELDKEYVFWIKDEMSSGMASLQEAKFYNRIINVFG